MPGMETKLHAVINHPGEYVGFSANYSGDGFSNMRFAFHGLDQAGFDQWVAGVRADSKGLDRETYLELEDVYKRQGPGPPGGRSPRQTARRGRTSGPKPCSGCSG